MNIALLKVRFHRMDHYPVKAKNATIVAGLIKKVSREASEKGRGNHLLNIRYLKHIAHATHGLDKLRFKVIIDFGPTV